MFRVQVLLWSGGSMKTILMLLVSSLSVLSANATVIVSEQNIPMKIDLNRAKVKWSNLGYGDSYFVKVIIPELTDITLLNHRNEGEDGPCMFTSGTDNVDNLIKDNLKTVDVIMNVRLQRDAWVTGEGDAKKCKVLLTEVLHAKINGFDFEHTRSVEMPERNLDDCR